MVSCLSKKKKINFAFNSLKEHRIALVAALIVFILFLTALYPAIFSRYQNYFVMSAVNWQDTAMHLSIIESISQGNFPPQAPYFSGVPLNYYYFIDLHSAILQTLYGDFFPQILIYDNPFFVLMFFLALYALTYQLFKNKLAALLAALLGTFSGNFLYYRFFQDALKAIGNTGNIFTAIKGMIATHSYTLDYGHLLQMVPMADYFLQNRPMMIGLPAIVLEILLLIHGFEKNSKKYFILAGLISGMLIKFQLFAFGVSILIVIFSWLFVPQQPRKKIDKLIYYFATLVIFIFYTLLFFKGSSSVIGTFLSNFRLGPWDTTQSFQWYLAFPFANFGILALIFLFFILLPITKTRKLTFLLVLSAVLYIIPHIFNFTIYDADMLKFFYFLQIPLSVIAGLSLQRFFSFSKLGKNLVILLVIISSFNSYLTLASSFLNKYEGYSEADYQAGMWIRNNTSPNSVFITIPTVHSAVSDIGGRLRVLSYTTWPYTHGFNKGLDNVFTRQADIESLYKDPTDTENTKRILNLYHINYLYLGTEENNKYPYAQQLFSHLNFLKVVYNASGIQIYQVL